MKDMCTTFMSYAKTCNIALGHAFTNSLNYEEERTVVILQGTVTGESRS